MKHPEIDRLRQIIIDAERALPEPCAECEYKSVHYKCNLAGGPTTCDRFRAYRALETEAHRC